MAVVVERTDRIGVIFVFVFDIARWNQPVPRDEYFGMFCRKREALQEKIVAIPLKSELMRGDSNPRGLSNRLLRETKRTATASNEQENSERYPASIDGCRVGV